MPPDGPGTGAWPGTRHPAPEEGLLPTCDKVRRRWIFRRPDVAKTETRSRGPAGRPPLEPEHPLSVGMALFQVFLLVGVPVAALLILKVLLRVYFPELGY